MNTNGFARHSDGAAVFALLAAGRGERFGGGKLTADLAGRPVWRWAADSAHDAGFGALCIVTNDAAIAAACTRMGWRAVANPDAATGIASSIKLAAGCASAGETLVVGLADMPFVGPALLRRLAATTGAAFTRQPDGRGGVPAAFDLAAGRRLRDLDGDRGASALAWPEAALIDAFDDDALFDIDTPAALEQARAIAVRRLRAADR